MSVAGSENVAPRPSSRPLLWALLISATVHFVGLVLVPLTYALLVQLAILPRPKPVELQPAKNTQKETMEALPLEFVEVDPSQAVKEAPKNTKYYSSRNAVAANPDPKQDTKTPKIEGKQTQVIRTESVQKPKSFPLQPTPKPAPPDQAKEEKPETKQKSAPKLGDLAMAKIPNPADKVAEKPTEDGAELPSPPEHVRPRTLAEAQAQNKKFVGEKMRQDGGVSHFHISPSFDTKATSFGAYDEAFIEAVQQHWYDLIDAQNWTEMHTGRVVLQFNLNYDGRITDMKVIDSDVDDLMSYLCQRAVLDPAPFAKWPSDMRRIIGSDQREVRFTFFYQ
jgi:outer membrane biosynthesis protein TonB